MKTWTVSGTSAQDLEDHVESVVKVVGRDRERRSQAQRGRMGVLHDHSQFQRLFAARTDRGVFGGHLHTSPQTPAADLGN